MAKINIVVVIVLLFFVILSVIFIVKLWETPTDKNVSEIVVDQNLSSDLFFSHNLSANSLILPRYNINIDCEYVMELKMQNKTVYVLCKETFPELYGEK